MWCKKTTDLLLWALMLSVWTEQLPRLIPKALVDSCMDGSRHPPHTGQKAKCSHFSIWVPLPVWRDVQHTVSLKISATGYRLLFQKCHNVVYQPLHIKHICHRAVTASPQETGKELARIEFGFHMHFARNNKGYHNPAFPNHPLKLIFETMRLWLRH